MKHTQGTWNVVPSNNEIINLDHGRLPFAIIAGHTLIGALYENEADARLIAASPELLKALKLCKNNISSLLASAHPKVYGEWLNVVNEAIEKAEATK